MTGFPWIDQAAGPEAEAAARAAAAEAERAWMATARVAVAAGDWRTLEHSGMPLHLFLRALLEHTASLEERIQELERR